MTQKEFRASAHELVDWMADYLEGVERYPVKSAAAPREIIRKLPRIAASLAKSTATYQRQIDNYRHRYALDPPLCAA